MKRIRPWVVCLPVLVLAAAAGLYSCGFIFPGQGPSGRYFDLTVVHDYTGTTPAVHSGNPLVIVVMPVEGDHDADIERLKLCASSNPQGTLEFHLEEGSYMVMGYVDQGGDRGSRPYPLPEVGDVYAIYPFQHLEDGHFVSIDLHDDETVVMSFDDSVQWVNAFVFKPYFWQFEKYRFVVTGGVFNEMVSESNLYFEVDTNDISSLIVEGPYIDHEKNIWAVEINVEDGLFNYTTTHEFMVRELISFGESRVGFNGYYNTVSLEPLDFNLIWPVEGTKVYGDFKILGSRFSQSVDPVYVNIGGGEFDGNAHLEENRWEFRVEKDDVSPGTKSVEVQGTYLVNIDVFN